MNRNHIEDTSSIATKENAANIDDNIEPTTEMDILTKQIEIQTIKKRKQKRESMSVSSKYNCSN